MKLLGLATDRMMLQIMGDVNGPLPSVDLHQLFDYSTSLCLYIAFNSITIFQLRNYIPVSSTRFRCASFFGSNPKLTLVLIQLNCWLNALVYRQ